MSKSQSNRITFAVMGSMAKWSLPHDMGAATLDLSGIPGIMEAIRAGGVLGEAVVFGIRQTVSNGAAVDRTDAAGNIIPSAILWRMKREGIDRRIAALAKNVWSEAAQSDGGMFRRVLERLAETSESAATILGMMDDGTLSDDRRDAIKKTATYRKTLLAIQAEGLSGLDDDLSAFV